MNKGAKATIMNLCKASVRQRKDIGFQQRSNNKLSVELRRCFLWIILALMTHMTYDSSYERLRGYHPRALGRTCRFLHQ